MPEILTPDLCVIGAGAAGLTAAAGAAAFGRSVVLVERARMGGECLNTGCVPSKALIAAAAHAHAARDGVRFGVSAERVAVDWAGVMAHVRGAIERIAPNDSAERFEELGVRVIKAEARFIDARTLAAGATRVRARRFVIATGSRPRLPDVDGLDQMPFLTNETLFDLDTRPEHLVILGGGPVGTEMAQAFCRLGSRVTLVQSRSLLPAEEPDLVAVIRKRLVTEGVRLLEHARARRVVRDGSAIQLDVEADGVPEPIVGSHLLVATGRTPVVDGLGLDAAGVRHGPRGIEVTPSLRTANRRIYAIGDALGGPYFTHSAGQDASLALRRILFRLPVRRDAVVLPRATFTDPPIAAVGLSEADARARFGGRATVLSVPFAENDRAVADGETDGMLKLVSGRRGRLLGAAVVGEKADEVVNLLSLAIAKKLTLRDLAGFVSPYPTVSDLAKRAATGHFKPFAANPFVRRIASLLAALG